MIDISSGDVPEVDKQRHAFIVVRPTTHISISGTDSPSRNETRDRAMITFFRAADMIQVYHKGCNAAIVPFERQIRKKSQYLGSAADQMQAFLISLT
jgi:hypothetical protein